MCSERQGQYITRASITSTGNVHTELVHAGGESLSSAMAWSWKKRLLHLPWCRSLLPVVMESVYRTHQIQEPLNAVASISSHCCNPIHIVYWRHSMFSPSSMAVVWVWGSYCLDYTINQRFIWTNYWSLCPICSSCMIGIMKSGRTYTAPEFHQWFMTANIVQSLPVRVFPQVDFLKNITILASSEETYWALGGLAIETDRERRSPWPDPVPSGLITHTIPQSPSQTHFNDALDKEHCDEILYS